MQRAPIVLSATALGLAATLGFHAHRPASAVSATTSTSTATPSGGASSSGSGSSGASSGSSGSSGSGSSSTTATKSVTSDAIGTQYGNVQLKVTISGGKITKVEALQLPGNEPKSSEI